MVVLATCICLFASNELFQGRLRSNDNGRALASTSIKLDKYLGATQNVRAYLESHENDGYFLGTAYGNTAPGVGGFSTINTWDCMYPNGDRKSNGQAYMNCAGFVAYVLRACGANIDTIASYTAKDGYKVGNATNASKWLAYCQDNGIGYKFNSIADALNSGVLEKGDVIHIEPNWSESGADCHIGFFWGNSPNDNKFWHSSTHPGSGNQISEIVSKSATVTEVYVFKTEKIGNISINKRSKIPELTEDNGNYSLAGAIYGVFTDSACTQRARDAYGNESGIITDDTGYGEARDLPIGTYWVKELSPATNYQLDTEVHQVTTQAGQTISAGVSSEPYNYGGIDLVKQSSNKDISDFNDCYTLAGAVYTIYSDNDGTQRVMDLTTNVNGYATTKGQDGEHNIVYGTYWIREVTAPQGYALDTTIYSVTFDKFDANGTVKRVNQTNGGVVQDSPQHNLAGLLLKKVDRETNGTSLGKASLSGAQFTVRFYDTLDVASLDKDYATRVAKALKTWVYETDDDGTINLEKQNPLSGDTLFKDKSGRTTFLLGIYEIEETQAPAGYLLPDYQNRTFVEIVRPVANSSTDEIETFGTEFYQPSDLNWSEY